MSAKQKNDSTGKEKARINRKAPPKRQAEPVYLGISSVSHSPPPASSSLPAFKKAYIFDLDGTLVTLPVNWEKVREELKLELKIGDQFPPILTMLDTTFADRPDIRRRVLSIIDRYEMEAVHHSSLIDGARNVIEKLATANSRLALVTLQGSPACDALIRKFDIKHHFEEILTRDDSLSRAKQIGMMMDMMRLSNGDVSMIGDRESDVISAKQVGVTSVFIGTKSFERAPDFNYPSMRDFLSAL